MSDVTTVKRIYCWHKDESFDMELWLDDDGQIVNFRVDDGQTHGVNLSDLNTAVRELEAQDNGD